MNRLMMLALVPLCAIGCAPQSPNDNFANVQRLTGDRSPHVVRWNQNSPEDATITKELREMLAKPLGAEEAVQIALLNNRSLQATFEDLGIAQADLVQAGLMTNPRFFASIRFPDVAPRTPDSEFAVAADFLDLLMIPLRKQIASDRLGIDERRVADAVLAMEHDVRVAFYTYQARRQAIALEKTIDEAQQIALDIARRQHQAGNISDLDLASEEATYSAMKLDLARTQAAALADREELNRLMGLWGNDSASWQTTEKLPELADKEPSMEHLESLAIRQRFDLDAARRETHLVAKSIGVTEQFRLSGLEIGVDTEHDPTGFNVTGPTLSVEIPIFDQKQAQIARLQAEYRQGLNRLTALAIDIRSHVRADRDRVIAAREMARFYRDDLIPQRRRVTQLSELHYNAMLLGIDRWLMARQSEVSAYKEYIETMRDYWIAKSDLERAVGGRLQ
jgi:cobalt-zinc-cadmium efflux system outer membrane protein